MLALILIIHCRVPEEVAARLIELDIVDHVRRRPGVSLVHVLLLVLDLAQHCPVVHGAFHHVPLLLFQVAGHELLRMRQASTTGVGAVLIELWLPLAAKSILSIDISSHLIILLHFIDSMHLVRVKARIFLALAVRHGDASAAHRLRCELLSHIILAVVLDNIDGSPFSLRWCSFLSSVLVLNGLRLV